MRTLTIELTDAELAALEDRARRENTPLAELSRLFLVGLMADDASWATAITALRGQVEPAEAEQALRDAMGRSQQASEAAGIPESVVDEVIAEVRASRG